MYNETRNNVTKEELEIIIKKVQWLLSKMESKQIEFIKSDPNTYLMNEFISIAGKGFINLHDLGSYVNEENEDFEIY